MYKQMTEQEKLQQAYWYTELCTNLELALRLSPKPNTAAREVAKRIIKRTPCKNVKLLAKKVSKMPLPLVWVKKQHNLITKGGMTVEDYYRQGVACKELITK